VRVGDDSTGNETPHREIDMPNGRALESKISKHLFLSAVVAVCCAVTFVSPATSQNYPARPISLIVPFSAGGGNDMIARIVSVQMAKTLGQPVVVENGPGAGGTTSTARVAQAQPDGYSIMIGHIGTHGSAPALYPSLKYDPTKDFTPIGLAAEQPMVIVTRKEFPANDLKQFVAYIQKNQGSVTEGHSGVGSASHIVCTLLQSIIDTKTARVAYRGAAPVVNDLLGGQIDFACLALSNVVSQIHAGSIKAIAIASPWRAEVIKDVPTTKEGGLPEFMAANWNGLFAPKNLPLDIQAKLNDALSSALDDETTRKHLVDVGCVVPDPADRTPQVLQKLVQREVARWTPLLKLAAVTAD
jgi:tripartite-type tricarboxylate transporter receptor subunit TctC